MESSRNNKGQFKKGQHWRKPKPYWDKKWLYSEYIEKLKSASLIAEEQNCGENNILYFLKKHRLHIRTMKEIRKNKRWGSSGKKNGMYGRSGNKNPRWKGGVTPVRQSLYANQDWKELQALVFKRDNYICQRCKTTHTTRNQIHVHHIKSFADYENLRLEESNLITLCKKCHSFVHSKRNIENEFL